MTLSSGKGRYLTPSFLPGHGATVLLHAIVLLVLLCAIVLLCASAFKLIL